LNIAESVDFIQFWVNKKTGAWYTIDESISVVDAGQMAMYRDIKPKYATSQWVKDALSPFREVYNFTTAVSGNVIVPDTEYLDLLDLQIFFQVSNRTVYAPVKLINEDERANRLNSQVNPVTTTSPIGEQIGLRTFRLYPAGVYNGNVTYLRRPVKPVYGYTVISGRVIVYDPNTSTQLEWRETEHIPLLLKGLQSLGINLSDAEIQNFAQIKTQENWQGINRL
jgi:hypothetical protein